MVFHNHAFPRYFMLTSAAMLRSIALTPGDSTQVQLSFGVANCHTISLSCLISVTDLL